MVKVHNDQRDANLSMAANVSLAAHASAVGIAERTPQPGGGSVGGKQGHCAQTGGR